MGVRSKATFSFKLIASIEELADVFADVLVKHELATWVVGKVVVDT